MTSRPVFHEKLGQYFCGLRTNKKWSLRRAEQIANNSGLRTLTKQVLDSLEKGRTKNPRPKVLEQLSKLYNVTYEEILGQVIEHGYGVKQFKFLAGSQTDADKLQNSSLPTSISNVQDAPIPQEDGGADSTISTARVDEVITAFSEATEKLNFLSDALAEQLADLGIAASRRKTRSHRRAPTKSVARNRATHR